MLARNGRALRAALGSLLVLGLLAAPVRLVWVNLDSDDDGLSDCRERHGLRTVGAAASWTTDPTKTDTDGDRVPDGEEVGLRSSSEDLRDAIGLMWSCEDQAYAARSNPQLPDSDGDGLTDDVELSEGSDVFVQDSDGDGLWDDAERGWGSDPLTADTDGDGFRDVEDVTDGLTPVRVDEAVDQEGWMREYADGLYYGDTQRVDSVPQLLGSLSGGASSAIPVIGWVTGTLADMRDVVANSLRRDWTAAGASGAGLVPYVGDAARSVKRTSQFVAENPALVRNLVGKLATWERIPDSVRIRLVGAADKHSVDRLLEHKLTDDKIVTLAKRGIHLAEFATFLDKAARTVHGMPEGNVDNDGFALSLEDAQSALRAYVADSDTADVFGEPVYIGGFPDEEFSGGRLIDACTACADRPEPGTSTLRIAKAGSQVHSETLQEQIDKDAYLKERGYAVEWHFLAGKTGLDVDPVLLDALAEAEIPFIVHLPR